MGKGRLAKAIYVRMNKGLVPSDLVDEVDEFVDTEVLKSLFEDVSGAPSNRARRLVLTTLTLLSAISRSSTHARSVCRARRRGLC